MQSCSTDLRPSLMRKVHHEPPPPLPTSPRPQAPQRACCWPNFIPQGGLVTIIACLIQLSTVALFRPNICGYPARACQPVVLNQRLIYGLVHSSKLSHPGSCCPDRWSQTSVGLVADGGFRPFAVHGPPSEAALPAASPLDLLLDAAFAA